MPKLEMAFFSNNRIAKYKPETLQGYLAYKKPTPPSTLQ